MKREIDRLDTRGGIALSQHIQVDQDRYMEVMRKLDAVAADIRHQGEVLEEMRDGRLQRKPQD